LQGSLRVDSTENVVLLKALSAFPETRLVLRATQSQRVYIVDVTAVANASKSDLELIDTRLSTKATDAPAQAATADDPRVALVRFAAREFYAPMRLRGGIDAVRVPVERIAVPLIRGGAINTVPVAAWSYQGIYLTAFIARNNTSERRSIDPRQVRGDWLAASSQHADVAAIGEAGDTTMLYLLSAQPYVVQP
jgi:integrating conjugative element protein (TIGR03749 family)